jgi:GTP-binding protein EngB required for normal cell division
VTTELLRSKKSDLQTRLEALREAVALADGRLDDSAVAAGRAVVERAGTRLSLGPDLTVVALAGATGSGKSSLFNALAGVELAPVGVRRPTTSRPQACVWGVGEAEALLDWLDVPRRHHLEGADLDGLVLLDLPDHDSRETSHRLEVDRLVEVVDLLAWVLDPQKYADGTLHEDYLKPLRRHSSVMVFVLNHSDELEAEALRSCLLDLRRLLENDGLEAPVIVASSARSGQGVEELRTLIGRAVATRRAAAQRLEADVTRAAERLASTCGEGKAPGRITAAERKGLTNVLSDAAGVELVARSVAGSHRRSAALRLGWPFTRWLRRFRPDPLRRFHLGAAPAGDHTSLPAASPAQRARVEVAVRALSERAAGTLPPPWPALALKAASRRRDELPDLLDQTVARSDLSSRPPRWWALGAWLQWVLAAAVLVGAVWLAALFVVDYLRLPEPPVPEWERFPLPTLLLVGGCLLGLSVAFLGGLVARVGAARRAAVVRRRLRAGVAEVGEATIVKPLTEELGALEKLCEALARARR